MKVYFNDRYDNMRLIAEVADENDAWVAIHNFCKERNFVIPYIRSWKETRDGVEMTKYDVGSHIEFFYVASN